MDERYPGWRVGLSRKVGAYIELISPFTLLAPLFGGLGASFIALVVQDFEGFRWSTLVYGVATLMILNAASNCMNAAYDAHIDRINKPYRPIPRGLVTRDEALSLAWFLYFLALTDINKCYHGPNPITANKHRARPVFDRKAASILTPVHLVICACRISL